MSDSHRNAILNANAITIGYRLAYLANFFTGPVYGEVMRRHGIARSEFVVLFCLQHVGTLSAQEVCEITGRPKNSISQAVTKLAAAGYIERRGDPKDARRMQLVATAAGRKLYSQVMPLFLERERAMLSPLSERELKQFDALLAKLVLRNDDWASTFQITD
jgi:MarR family transcriptional regulator, temperature-dependent positive regulator of motility